MRRFDFQHATPQQVAKEQHPSFKERSIKFGDYVTPESLQIGILALGATEGRNVIETEVQLQHHRSQVLQERLSFVHTGHIGLVHASTGSYRNALN